MKKQNFLKYNFQLYTTALETQHVTKQTQYGDSFFLFFKKIFLNVYLLLRDRETQSVSRGEVERGETQNLK